MPAKQVIRFFRYTVVLANMAIILCIFYNAIIGFNGTAVEKFSYLVLMGLFAVNSFLLLSRIKEVSEPVTFLRYAAISGNLVFLFWILFNGINEGFKASIAEKFYYIGLMVILSLNSFCLLARSKQTGNNPEVRQQ